MKWWQIALAVVCLWIVYGWVCHIMGGLRELARKIDVLDEKVDAIQKELRSIASDLESERIDEDYVNPID